MSEQPLNNSKIIIPAVIVMWLVGILFINLDMPGWTQVVFIPVLFLSILFLVGFLFLKQSGWHQLVRNYPYIPQYFGEWKTCPTAVMSSLTINDPHYNRRRVRLNFVLKVGSDNEALYFSTIAVFRLLLPPMRIPFSSITKASYFDAKGWTQAPSKPGSLINISYDPGYRGEFLEIEITEPKIFIQLPANLLTEAIPHLPVTQSKL